MRSFPLPALLLSGALFAQESRPLPPVAELRARAVANYARTADQRERYLCRLRVTQQELDGKGRTKKTTVLQRENFFVNGTEISQTLSRDGKPLSAGNARKQEEAVKKEIAAATDGRHKRGAEPFRIADLLRFAILSDERRVEVSGRPTIVFTVAPDPHAKTTDLAQRFIADLAGTVSIDEATGTLQDANVHGVNDVRVGGGVLANVHKGFAVHLVAAPQADGVWLIKTIDGQGDARVGLFLHEAGRFRQETEGCRLYDVSSDQKGDTVHGAPPQ